MHLIFNVVNLVISSLIKQNEKISIDLKNDFYMHFVLVYVSENVNENQTNKSKNYSQRGFSIISEKIKLSTKECVL